MGARINWVCSVAAVFAAFTVADVASAQVNPPNSTFAIEARIGRRTSDSKSVVIWKRKSNGACLGTTVLSNGPLDATKVINGTVSFGDTMVVQAATETHCATQVAPLNFNGNLLEVRGLGANDVLLGTITTAGFLHMFGGDGGDIVAASGTNAKVYGEGGNDDVETWGPATGHELYGDGAFAVPGFDGEDCLYDENKDYSIANCGGAAGPGDVLTTDMFLPLAIVGDCPATSSTNCCTWAYFTGLCTP